MIDIFAAAAPAGSVTVPVNVGLLTGAGTKPRFVAAAPAAKLALTNAATWANVHL